MADALASTVVPSATSYACCRRCLMDSSDPEIEIYDDGTCNHCSTLVRRLDWLADEDRAARERQALVADIKSAGQGRDYDCIVGMSGGVDSTYVAYTAKRLGLRPLAVHVDNGWNSELAVKNIQNALDKLGIDLETVVLDWETFRDLQVSFLKASVPDAEIPTDHAIRAALQNVARKRRIKYLLNGRNFRTEGILPWSWTYSALDWRYISAVHRRYGRSSLASYPHLSLDRLIYDSAVARIQNINILNYVPYDKQDTMSVLQNELSWRDYGGKHYESLYTRFFQAYYLPIKFGIDKRHAHYSVLVLNGQMSREKALQVLQQPPVTPEVQERDKQFVVKKLGLSEREFDAIMSAPLCSYRDFPNNGWIFHFRDNPRTLKAIELLRGLGVFPRNMAAQAVPNKNAV